MFAPFFSLEDTYDRYQQFASAGQNVNEADQNGNNVNIST